MWIWYVDITQLKVNIPDKVLDLLAHFIATNDMIYRCSSPFILGSYDDVSSYLYSKLMIWSFELSLLLNLSEVWCNILPIIQNEQRHLTWKAHLMQKHQTQQQKRCYSPLISFPTTQKKRSLAKPWMSDYSRKVMGDRPLDVQLIPS